MSKITAVHIIFDQTNDPGRVVRRHIGREMSKGKLQSDIVKDAWLQRSGPGRTAVTTASISAPPFNPVELYYDPAVVSGASEEDVLATLRKAG